MAVFRVEKTRDFTVMSNHHLRNKELTLKAKGLLSLILSLHENWDYTTRGLAAICKENKDTIGKIINELILWGYVIRHQERGEGGKLGRCVYTIYENPQTEGIPPCPKKQDTALPCPKNPDTAKPCMENPSPLFPDEINTYIANKDEQSTDRKNKNQENTDVLNSNLISSSRSSDETLKVYTRSEREKIRIDLKNQVDFDYLSSEYPDEDLLYDVFDILLDIAVSTREYWRVGGERVATWELKERIKRITSESMELIMDSFLKQSTEIKNPKAYLVKCLYNAPVTQNAYWGNQVRAHGSIASDGLHRKRGYS